MSIEHYPLYVPDKYAYNASAVNCSKDSSAPVTFFSFEWQNPRFGKKVREVNLRSVINDKGDENAIILLGLSVSESKKKGEILEAEVD